MSKRYLEAATPRLAKKLKMKPEAVRGRNLEIDEDLHSRQLAVYGKDSMKRMACSNILICGAQGLGVEAAKNVILSGVRAVTLHDPATVQLSDLSAQFYLTAEDVGKNRAEACKNKLQDLNTSVQVTAAVETLTPGFINQYQVVLVTNLSLEDSVKIDDLCHRQNIAFIRANIHGVFASIFCDFGPSFRVYDTDGEEPHTGIIAGIAPGNTTLVTCVEDDRLGFQDGQSVTFTEVQGMTELNDGCPRKIRNCKAHSFEVEDNSNRYSPYLRGGLVTQVKETKELKFKALYQALKEPGEFLISDFSKLERSAILHKGFQALDAFQAQEGRMPKPHHSADADALVQIAEKIFSSPAMSKGDKDVIRNLSFTAVGQLAPMAALIGGIIGQEVLKATSGKFHPIYQWLYFDAMECLPESPLSSQEVAPRGNRYDHQIAVFGHSIQMKLENMKVFLVGAGALGCEFLKNFAMMGISAGEGGRIVVTDDDTIEKSNLSRQFLFRDWDIGRPKSTVASQASTCLNPAFRPCPLQNRVSPHTEDIFDDAFWNGLDIVVNALDNVSARLYVDSRCVYFQKALLESGTLGPKCNTQVVVPGITENYGASRDPPEKQAPMCTLHSFPHSIDHCLTFARSEFEGLLEKAPSEANAYLADPEKYVNMVKQASDAAARQQLEKVVEVLSAETCATFDDCIVWARKKFEYQFHERIAQLIFTFPEDAITSTGSPFWSAPKRFPHPLTFDGRDQAHAKFCQAAAILKAQVYSIPAPQWAADPEQVGMKAANVDIPVFIPRQGVRIETDPSATKVEQSNVIDDSTEIESLALALKEACKNLPRGFRLQPIIFEKDDDTNFHMDFISSLANMRARNYAIPEVEKFKAKIIAGKIIPAVATATALATGLVCLEMYKMIQAKDIESYRNTFANLALPLIAMAEPVPPKYISYKGQTWSMWDRWILEGDLTVQQALDWFTEKGMEAYSISCGQSLLYNNIFPKHRDRLTRKLSELVRTVAKLEIPTSRNYFDVVVACEDADGEDLDVPLISIRFR